VTTSVGKKREGKGTKHLATEKQRREQLNGKYKILRSLIPSPTKKAKDDATESCNIKSFSNPDRCIRTSWLQRKLKDSEVDVQIADDDVTIKLFQRKKINCLLSVAKFLDELQLELHHVAGGH
ncbi:hypothetical protein S83_015290, partial [Arachis hypogaea]